MQTKSTTTRPHTNGHSGPRTRIARFALGQTYITPGAQEALQMAGQTELEFLRKHMSGDWSNSELGEEDIQENKLSLEKGFRILSAYLTCKGQKLWIITEADRSSTTILLPEEY
jgi:hypothetical protein